MQVCTSLQTDNHASNPPLSFLQAECPSCCPTNSVKALKAFLRSEPWSYLSLTVKLIRLSIQYDHDLEKGTCGHMCEYYTQDFMAVLVHARRRHCLHTRWTSSGWLIVLASSGRQEPLTISRQSTTSALHQLLLLLHQTLQPVMAEAPQRQSEFNCTLSHYQNLCWASSISSQHNAALTAAKHRLL